jgi:hypothetical protein
MATKTTETKFGTEECLALTQSKHGLDIGALIDALQAVVETQDDDVMTRLVIFETPDTSWTIQEVSVDQDFIRLR